MKTGFLRLAQTVCPEGTVQPATATGFAEVFIGPSGTATGVMDVRHLTTNDVIKLSPRGTVPLSTTGIFLSYARMLSVGTASAIVEVTLGNGAFDGSATAVANTWNMDVMLASADL